MELSAAALFMWYFTGNTFIVQSIPQTSEPSSTMRALSSARCTGVRLYTLRIKIGTDQRALGELSHC